MRVLFAEQTVGRGALRVVADRYPRLLQRQGYVGLRHDEHGHLGESVVFDQQVEDRVDGVFMPQRGDLGDDDCRGVFYIRANGARPWFL